MDLTERWAPLVEPWGGPPGEVARAGEALLARYAEPHRRYHTVAHLRAVLDDLALDLAVEPVAVSLAAWFHDAVYDPRAAPGSNEARSAALAEAMLYELGAPAGTVGAVRRLVLSTVDHRVEPGDVDGAVLADADLAILGTDPRGYGGYVEAVRREYGWLGEGEWRTGRSAVLAGFLARGWIYTTDRGRARWERSARRNLGGELAALLAQT